MSFDWIVVGVHKERGPIPIPYQESPCFRKLMIHGSGTCTCSMTSMRNMSFKTLVRSINSTQQEMPFSTVISSILQLANYMHVAQCTQTYYRASPLSRREEVEDKQNTRGSWKQVSIPWPTVDFPITTATEMYSSWRKLEFDDPLNKAHLRIFVYKVTSPTKGNSLGIVNSPSWSCLLLRKSLYYVSVNAKLCIRERERENHIHTL